MDRRLFLSSAAVFGACAVLAPSRRAAAQRHLDTAPDIARILNRGVLRVAAYQIDTPPFFFTDAQGKKGGIDVDIAADIAARLGVSLDYACIAGSFDELPGLVIHRKADVVISYFSRTLRRAAKVHFTQPYAKLRQALLVSRVKTADLLRGSDHAELLNDPSILIGVEEGSSYVDFAAERFPKARLRRFPGNDKVIAELLKGNLHGMMVDEAYARALNNPQPGVPRYDVPDDWALHVKTILLAGAVDPIAMAVNREDLSWLAWLNTYIADRSDDGSLDRILTRYMGGKKG